MSGIASILIVDDNPKILIDALPMYGYNVQVANDGIEALKLLNDENNRFDLVLLDVMMPKMNGWETLKAIRKNDKIKYIPIIMVSAIGEEQNIVSGLKIGADDYVTKPFVLPNLLARIEAILRRSKWNNKTNNNSTKKKATPYKFLTQKEIEVLSLVAKGNSNQEIAEKMFVQSVTIKTHLNSIFKKLNVTNRTQAVLLAMQMDLIN